MRDELIEALKNLGRGRIDAAEVIVDLVFPKVDDPRKTFAVKLPVVDAMPQELTDWAAGLEAKKKVADDIDAAFNRHIESALQSPEIPAHTAKKKAK